MVASAVARSAGVEAQWPAEPPSGRAQRRATFSFLGARLPPGAIERCVGSVGTLPGCVLLECWRLGALLSNGAVVALLERGADGTSLTAEVRGEGEAAGLEAALSPLVAVVERVLKDYSGVVYSKEMTPGANP